MTHIPYLAKMQDTYKEIHTLMTFLQIYILCFAFFLKYISFVFSKTVLNLTFITTTKQSLPNYLPTIYFFYLFIILFIICQFNLVFEPIASFLGGTKLQPSDILL